MRTADGTPAAIASGPALFRLMDSIRQFHPALIQLLSIGYDALSAAALTLEKLSFGLHVLRKASLRVGHEATCYDPFWISPSLSSSMQESDVEK